MAPSYRAKCITARRARDTTGSLHHRTPALWARLNADRGSLLQLAGSQHLLSFATVAKHRDAFASKLVSQEESLFNVVPSRGAAEIHGLANGIFHVPLKSCLHADMPLRLDVMCGYKHAPDRFRDF